MPASAIAETTQVRQNLSTLAANEVTFPALEQMRERCPPLHKNLNNYDHNFSNRR